MLLLKSLVLAEVRDGQPERVDRNHRIGNAILDHENEVRGVLFAFQLGSVAVVVLDPLEVHSRLVR